MPCVPAIHGWDGQVEYLLMHDVVGHPILPSTATVLHVVSVDCNIQQLRRGLRRKNEDAVDSRFDDLLRLQTRGFSVAPRSALLHRKHPILSRDAACATVIAGNLNDAYELMK